MGLVAEDGPEAIIPLSGKRRGLGLSLWQQASELLGVKPHANGGLFGRTNSNNYGELTDTLKSTPFRLDLKEDTTDDVSTLSTGTSGQLLTASGITIEVNVGAPSITISGDTMDESSIVNIIKTHIREMADDRSDEIAQSLEKVLSNMPLKQY